MPTEVMTVSSLAVGRGLSSISSRLSTLVIPPVSTMELMASSFRVT